MIALAFAAAVLLGWGLLYVFYIRHMLSEIRFTMGDAVGKLEGAKTAILSFGISIVGVLGVLADDTELLDQFKDQALLTSVFGSNAALKIVSALTLVIPVLHLIGKLKAAKTPPQA